jgi:catechol 2,3-dioxygenase-like lactoylglutathione lyase family enzyme
MLIPNAKYGHTNVIARDWERLARFYEEVFGCIRLKPERNFAGATLDAATGVPGARLTGVHLRLPGYEPGGPTIEIFSYSILEESGAPAVNRCGWGHIAFAVADVRAAQQMVFDAGGEPVGEIVTLEVGDGRRVTFCYVTDPEGNVLELQSWA